MKFPLDEVTYAENIGNIVNHERTQSAIIQKMGDLLMEAMDYSETDGDDWYKDSETLLKEIQALKMWHESRRFNETVLKAKMPEKEGPEISAFSEEEPGPVEMSEDDLARHFKEKRSAKKEKQKSLKEMSLNEIESWEKAQENATDIYKIKARVANLARGSSMSLTPVGEILCNSYTHVLKALYDFADKIEDANVRTQLTQLIRNQEGMPGTIIAAAGAGVQEKTSEKPRRKV